MLEVAGRLVMVVEPENTGDVHADRARSAIAACRAWDRPGFAVGGESLVDDPALLVGKRLEIRKGLDVVLHLFSY